MWGQQSVRFLQLVPTALLYLKIPDTGARLLGCSEKQDFWKRFAIQCADFKLACDTRSYFVQSQEQMAAQSFRRHVGEGTGSLLQTSWTQRAQQVGSVSTKCFARIHGLPMSVLCLYSR